MGIHACKRAEVMEWRRDFSLLTAQVIQSGRQFTIYVIQNDSQLISKTAI